MTTPNLMLPEVPRAIRNASPAINAGMLTIDAILQPAVISRAVSSQPTDPVQGDRYIIPGGASGVWNAHPGHIAYYGPNGWQYLVPRPGWLVWSIADGSFYVYTNGEWQEWTSGGGGTVSPLTTKG